MATMAPTRANKFDITKPRTKPIDRRLVHRKVLDGLPFQTLATFEKYSGLTRPELCNYLDIPTTTMSRRQKDGRFSPAESERILRLAKVVNSAVELFCDDVPAAIQWLKTPAVYYDGERPIEMTRTQDGAEEIESFIFRISNGIFM
jgi:putative toxin-antitoxin system antitoxin component (TIGR02293 family)